MDFAELFPEKLTFYFLFLDEFLCTTPSLSCLTHRAQSQHGLATGKHLDECKVWLNPSLVGLKNINTPREGNYSHEGPAALEIHLVFISAST